ncbi:unnamed protein product [Penicillium nalgiovense]|nr:unnamed protein product [Penicillium nalgiovense]
MLYLRQSMGMIFLTEHSIWAKWKSSKCFLTSAPSIKDIAFFYDGLSIQLAVLGGEAVFRLLQRGVQLQPGCIGHSRALGCAAMLANVPTLKMLLDAGFSLDERDRFGWASEPIVNRGVTLLSLAAQAKDRDAAQAAVSLLLERRVQLNQPIGSCNYTPLLCMVSGVAGKFVWDIKWFIQKISKTEADEEDQREKLCEELFDTTDRDILTTKLLLEKGADPLLCNGNWESVLALAAWKNDIGAVKMLLEYVDQEVPLSTMKSHIMAAMDPSDHYHGILKRRKQEPSFAIEKMLWNYYWRKAYPPSE